MKIALFTISVLLFGRGPLAGQEGSGGEWTAFTSMRSINGLLVHNGEIWSATTGGVLRYNEATGVYARYTRLDGLAGNDVQSLVAAGDGDLWFGTDGRGLSRFLLAQNRFQAPFLEFRDRRIEALAVLENRIFVGTDQGISVFLADREEVKETYRQLGRLPKDTQVTALAVFDGRLWAGTDEGVSWADLSLPNLQDPESWTSTLGPRLVSDMLVDGDLLLLSTARGVYSFALGGNRAQIDFDNVEIENLGFLAGQVVGATGSGALFVRNGPDAWSPLEGPAVGQVTGLSSKSETLWLATDAGLRVIGGEAPPMTREPADNLFYKMALVGTNELWVATAERDFGEAHGLYKFDGTGWDVFSEPPQAPRIFMVSLETDSRGQLWAGSWGAAISVRDSSGRWQAINRFNSVLEGIDGGGFVVVSDIQRDANGLMWISNVLVGLAVMDSYPSTQSHLYRQDVLGLPAGREINNIAFGLGGIKWLSTPRDGFILFDDGGTPFEEGDEFSLLIDQRYDDRLTSNRVKPILALADGSVWVGTNSGLNAVYGTYDRDARRFDIDRWRIYRVAEGLPSNQINALAEDDQGNVWVGTESGVVQIGADGEINFVLTSSNSGLINDKVKSLLFEPTEGMMWIATLDGLSRLQVGKAETGTVFSSGVYPNPFVIGRGSQLTFGQLPLGASVQIFAMGGELVRRIEGVPGRGSLNWDGLNEAGFLVGSGVYYYVAQGDGGAAVKGKFAVIIDR